MSIGNRIKEERERLGYSQDAFAAVGGVSKRSQIMYEQDKTEAGAGYFTLISTVGADVKYILTDIRSQPYNAIQEVQASYQVSKPVGVIEDMMSRLTKLESTVFHKDEPA
jgi:transcriptional regulator with XRE-family HTH domain